MAFREGLSNLQSPSKVMKAVIPRGTATSTWTLLNDDAPPLDLRISVPQDAERQQTNHHIEQKTQDEIERLGRERPPVFKSAWSETAFVFSISMSQILNEYFVSGFILFLGTLVQDFGISPASSVWAGTSFSLVVASTLLVFGRLGDMLGAYPIYLAGQLWLLGCSIIAGFSVNPVMLIIARSLQGLGAAAFLPTGVMLMGSVYRPGPRKNLVFAIYGTCTVIGFYVGILLAGIVGQFSRWSVYFWIGAGIAGFNLTLSIFFIPRDQKSAFSKRVTMDWLGAGTIVPGIILVVFAITESANATDGWRTPYIPTFFCLGCIFLFAAIYVEGWVAELPLLPADFFAVPGMKAFILAMMLMMGNIGIWMLYGTLYFENIMGATPLQVVAWFAPMFIGGICLSTLEGFILHIVPSRVLLIVSCLGSIGSQLLMALIPIGGNYWAWVLPSMILGTIGIDLSINLMMIFITTQLPVARQGLGGGVVNSIIQLGIAFSLGCTNIIQTYTQDKAGLKQSYQYTFWFGAGAGTLSLILLIIWVDIPKAKSDYTADEREQMRKDSSDHVSISRLSGRTVR